MHAVERRYNTLVGIRRICHCYEWISVTTVWKIWHGLNRKHSERFYYLFIYKINQSPEDIQRTHCKSNCLSCLTFFFCNCCQCNKWYIKRYFAARHIRTRSCLCALNSHLCASALWAAHISKTDYMHPYWIRAITAYACCLTKFYLRVRIYKKIILCKTLFFPYSGILYLHCKLLIIQVLDCSEQL